MAKVSGPLMSMDAAGSLGKVRFRRGRGGRVQVYHDGAPGSRRSVSPSARQLEVRGEYAAANAAWRALDPSERAAWDETAAADSRAVSGWNLYLAQHMEGLNTMPGSALLLASGSALYLEGSDGRLLLEDAS